MMSFKDVKAKFGQKQGETIYAEKKSKEDSKPKDDATTYFMKHPDCKDQDSGYVQTNCCFLIFNSNIIHGCFNWWVRSNVWIWKYKWNHWIYVRIIATNAHAPRGMGFTPGVGLPWIRRWTCRQNAGGPFSGWHHGSVHNKNCTVFLTWLSNIVRIYQKNFKPGRQIW